MSLSHGNNWEQLVAPDVLEAAVLYALTHGSDLRARDFQPSTPVPPWPARHNVMLRYLLHAASGALAAGRDPQEVMIHLAACAWFEGNIEGREQQAAVVTQS